MQWNKGPRKEHKKMNRMVTMLVVMAFFAYNVFASSYTSGNFTYSYYSGSDKAQLQRYSGSSSSVSVPSKFSINDNTYYVTEIYAGAFKNNQTITSVSWTSNLKSIGGDAYYGGAFEGCTNLSDIPSLSGITAISWCAFAGCTSLKSVEIPNTVSSLSMNAFERCTGLKTAIVNCEGINVPSGLFGGCSSLESVVFGDGIIGIDGYWSGYVTYAPRPLEGCNKLKNISLGRGIAVIPESFIYGLSLVERVTSSGAIKLIGNYAFYGCASLVDIPSLSAVTNIGSSAFYNCSKIESFQFGKNLKSIGSSAFYNCTNASAFTFAGTPPSVGSSAFSNVKSGARGYYTTTHAAEWEAVIDANGYWNGLKMRPYDYIELQASTNLYDSIKLSWEVSSGLSGARYFIERRMNENGSFERINPTKPINENQFSDTACLPGVNYYYRVISESGVECKQVVGKRVAKTVEPEFSLEIKSSFRPSTLGSSGEDSILVAGEPVLFNISPTNYNNGVISYKRITIIGIPQGGAKAQKEHEIRWAEGGIIDFISAYQEGQLMHQGNNIVSIVAILQKGPGYHGKYKWLVRCDYEIDGKSGWAAIQLDKNVYFHKEGDDNGERAEYKSGKPIALSRFRGDRIPNWYAYWRDDAAVPGLKMPKVSYRGKFDSQGIFRYGGSSDGTNVYIDKDASAKASPLKINNQNWSEYDRWFFTRRVNNVDYAVCGIYHVQDIVAHEQRHNITRKHYYEQIQSELHKSYFEASKAEIRTVDSDYDSEWCVFYTGDFARCRGEGNEVERSMGDKIVDDDEKEITPYLYEELGVHFGFHYYDADTYKLGPGSDGKAKKHWSYGGYGDNELVSMVAGRQAMDNVHPDQDWAYPGEQSGFNFSTVVNLGGGTRSANLLSASPKTSQSRGESDSIPSTNLYISLTGISCHIVSNENNVTGLVYTIGVSIQGDEIVEFNGYLYDAQSNTVVTAISAASSDTTSVELFFDARDIFENSSGGPYTLGRVELTVDDNYSTNNVLTTLYDFAVEPIEVAKEELLCNKGYILDTVINEQSETGVVATVSTKINIADAYLVSAELVSTNDELVAYASVSNLCVVGTNTFRLAFSSDAIYQNGISGICAVKNVKLWQNGELVDADATGAELSSVYACSDFVPSNICVAVDLDSGRFIAPSMTTDGKLSSLRFVFNVTNGTDTAIGYDVAAVLTGTNSALAASINTIVHVTNGVNQIELTIPASDLAASGVGGPYRFESIELRPQGDSTCGTTYRPNVLSESYVASDFGASAIKPCGMPRLIDTPDGDRLVVEYSYQALRVGHVIAEVVLADRNGDFAARIVTTNDVSETGVKTNVISVARNDVANAGDDSPYAVASLSVVPDIIGESPVYMDTESLTNIFWQVAAPVFAPATKTVFFRNGQPVVISCVTPAAEIRYTLDGSEPTDTSALYEGPFTISSNTTVKAKAFAEGMRPSKTVQAEYVRAAIVGDNLVQDTSPRHGTAQALNVPVAGTYQVSFDYTQGGDVELRLLQDGTVRTLAAVSAESAGNTNFVFDVSAAGDYELMVYDLSSGTLLPAEVSNLSVSIPDTPENRKRFWIYETESTYCSTGEWVTEEGFKNGKMHVKNISTFLPYTRSDGRFVTIVSEIEFLIPFRRETQCMVDEKCAIGIGETEDGGLTFIILTKEDGVKMWKPVGAKGLAEPTLGTPYTVKLLLDYTNKTYSASIIEHGDVEKLLAHGTTNEFAFADKENTAVEQIVFLSRGNVMSLSGKYQDLKSEFECGDTIPIAGGNMPIVLTGSQATWLNSMNAYDSVKAKIATMGQGDFNDAYLLNLDISQSEFGLGKFKVTGIDVTESEVRISVILNRTGAVQVSRGNECHDAPINGILKLYGGESPNDKTLLNATIITDANFGSGNTEVFVYPRSGSAKFFRPAIVSP